MDRDRTEFEIQKMHRIFELIFQTANLLQIFKPYTYSSEQFAVRGAMEALGKALPEDDQKDFEKWVFEKTHNLSNYSGD